MAKALHVHCRMHREHTTGTFPRASLGSARICAFPPTYRPWFDPTRLPICTPMPQGISMKDRWDDGVAAGLDPLGRLVYRSNLLGSDPRITNTGGGNTSSKLIDADPITGESVEVLWVKGSGGDLRTAGRAHFAALYQQRLLDLQQVYERFEERGPKTPAEDAMVGMYPHAAFGLRRRTPSIDTPLHGFVPYRHVDHTHPWAVIALATAGRGPECTRGRVWGRGGMGGLATSGLRAGVEAAAGLRGPSAGSGSCARWARAHQLG